MANAVSTLRSVLKSHEGGITLAEIAEKCTLATSEISMALCYLLKQRYVTRSRIAASAKMGRKQIWSYTYYNVRLP
jgi:DNA-binding IclR family transcriptional regulator